MYDCLMYDLYVRSDCIKKSSIHIQLLPKNWVWESVHAIAHSELFSDCSVNLQIVGVGCSLEYTEMKTKGLSARKVVSCGTGQIQLRMVIHLLCGHNCLPSWKGLYTVQVRWLQGGGLLRTLCCSTLLTTLKSVSMAAISVKRNLSQNTSARTQTI